MPDTRLIWLTIIISLSLAFGALLFTSPQQVANAIMVHDNITNSTVNTDKPLTPQYNSIMAYDKSHLSPAKFEQKVKQIGRHVENTISFCNSSPGGLINSRCNELISTVSILCQGKLARENVFECSNPTIADYLRNRGIT